MATLPVVSGTVAERIKLWPFMIFTVVLTSVLYPITGSWPGRRRLAEMGFATSPVQPLFTLPAAGSPYWCHHPWRT
ncbi:hypothetical protein [Thalassospira alkalitolerans]|uniref:hypothetical protein n=1 Tax=Thalassospira alkalitolerans TaxID=1293890 RepID=UPI003AA8F5DE